MSLVVLVTGSRAYKNRLVIYNVLDALDPDEVIEGGAAGADAITLGWAKKSDVPCHSFPPQWDLHGRAAGPIRNQQMLGFLLERCPGMDKLVVAFPMPDSKGTWDMVERARRARVETRVDVSALSATVGR